MRVDDREVGVDALVDDSVIGGTEALLFLGGFPDGIVPPGEEIPAAAPLIGCIADVIHDYRSV